MLLFLTITAGCLVTGSCAQSYRASLDNTPSTLDSVCAFTVLHVAADLCQVALTWNEVRCDRPEEATSQSGPSVAWAEHHPGRPLGTVHGSIGQCAG